MKEDFKKELEGLSPKLAKFKAKQAKPPSELPLNYFHNMQVEVMSKLDSELKTENSEKKAAVSFFTINALFNFLKKPQVSFALGAGLLLLVAGIFWTNQNITALGGMANLTDDEILDYINDNINDFDAVSLSEISDEEFLFDESFDDNEVEKYLEDNLDQIDDTDFENLF